MHHLHSRLMASTTNTLAFKRRSSKLLPRIVCSFYSTAVHLSLSLSIDLSIFHKFDDSDLLTNKRCCALLASLQPTLKLHCRLLGILWAPPSRCSVASTFSIGSANKWRRSTTTGCRVSAMRLLPRMHRFIPVLRTFQLTSRTIILYVGGIRSNSLSVALVRAQDHKLCEPAQGC